MIRFPSAIHLQAHDLAQAKAWYEQAFGLKAADEVDCLRYAFGNTAIVITQGRPPEGGGPLVELADSDTRATLARLRAMQQPGGGALVADLPGGSAGGPGGSLVTDPFGNRFLLRQLSAEQLAREHTTKRAGAALKGLRQQLDTMRESERQQGKRENRVLLVIAAIVLVMMAVVLVAHFTSRQAANTLKYQPGPAQPSTPAR